MTEQLDDIICEPVPLSLWDRWADPMAPKRDLDDQERAWIRGRMERMKREGRNWESFCLPFARPTREE